MATAPAPDRQVKGQGDSEQGRRGLANRGAPSGTQRRRVNRVAPAMAVHLACRALAFGIGIESGTWHGNWVLTQGGGGGTGFMTGGSSGPVGYRGACPVRVCLRLTALA